MIYINRTKVGDRVKVKLPMDFDESTIMIKKFDGQVMEVSRKGRGYVELKGAESRHGVPYCFIPEWLTRA